MVRLFLWRDLEQDKEPGTLAITKLNMGDKPSTAIAQIALQQTADMAPESKKEAKEVMKNNSYMDDIMTSLTAVILWMKHKKSQLTSQRY